MKDIKINKELKSILREGKFRKLPKSKNNEEFELAFYIERNDLVISEDDNNIFFDEIRTVIVPNNDSKTVDLYQFTFPDRPNILHEEDFIDDIGDYFYYFPKVEYNKIMKTISSLEVGEELAA